MSDVTFLIIKKCQITPYSHCKDQIATFAKSFVFRLLCSKTIYLQSGGRVVDLPPILAENHTLSCPFTFFEGLVLLPSKHSVFINEENERKTKNDFRSFCSFFRRNSFRRGVSLCAVLPWTCVGHYSGAVSHFEISCDILFCQQVPRQQIELHRPNQHIVMSGRSHGWSVSHGLASRRRELSPLGMRRHPPGSWRIRRSATGVVMGLVRSALVARAHEQVGVHLGRRLGSVTGDGCSGRWWSMFARKSRSRARALSVPAEIGGVALQGSCAP